MIKTFVVAALLLLTSAVPVLAANNFSHVRCEDQKVADFIKKALYEMKYDNGISLSTYLDNNSKLTATTVMTAVDRFACKITVNYRVNGASKAIRGKFTYREFASGKASETFAPLY